MTLINIVSRTLYFFCLMEIMFHFFVVSYNPKYKNYVCRSCIYLNVR